MPSAQSFFELPSDYRRLADLLSANAQMYLQCDKCGWEDRANLLYFLPSKALLTEPCSRCGATEHRPVRHVESVQGRCVDCGHDLTAFKTVPWEESRCPNCHSHRLEVRQIEVDPPYPSRFGEVGDRSPFGNESDNFMQKDQPWGVDAASDAKHLQLEIIRTVHQHPADSYLYTRCEALFGESLLARNEYAEDDPGFATFVSQLGNVMRDYFQQVGGLTAGLRALELNEGAVGIERDPETKAGWEHNTAIMINSLLVRYPEEKIAEATDRPNIRKEALGYAARALFFYIEQATAAEKEQTIEDEEEGESDAEGFTYATQAGRTFHLMGDLLRIGKSTNEERRQALEAYGEALKWDLPQNLLPGLLQSLAETTLMLEDATDEELASAWTGLEAALNAETKRLGRSAPWASLWHMAQIAERLGDGTTELDTLDKAARVAMAVVRQNLEEFGLQARSESMAPLFDSLAYRYAEDGKAASALAATEALRAATVRLHTKTQQEKVDDLKEMVGQAARDRARAHIRQAGQPVNLVDSVLSSSDARIDSVEPGLKRLLQSDKKTPTAIVSFTNLVDQGDSFGLFAFVCGGPSKSEQTIRCQELHSDLAGMEWDAALVRPGPFRERRLQRMHAAVGDAFIAPILPRLQEMGVKRIVFSLPAILSRYAFEALPVGKNGNGWLVRHWEVAYVPSIAIAMDQPERTPQRNGRLLVVGYQGDDLTHAAGEVEGLRKLFGDAMTLLSGKECTKVTVLEHLTKPYDFIHFVCHGTYDEAMPLDAALHLVPDVEDDSQRVTAGDISVHVEFQQRPLITMSACSTALMSVSPVNNCHGLTGGFLRAGARGVIGSRWPVYDATAALFMSSFYQKIIDRGDAPPLRCLTEVQRELAADNGIEDFASFGYMGMP